MGAHEVAAVPDVEEGGNHADEHQHAEVVVRAGLPLVERRLPADLVLLRGSQQSRRGGAGEVGAGRRAVAADRRGRRLSLRIGSGARRRPRSSMRGRGPAACAAGESEATGPTSMKGCFLMPISGKSRYTAMPRRGAAARAVAAVTPRALAGARAALATAMAAEAAAILPEGGPRTRAAGVGAGSGRRRQQPRLPGLGANRRPALPACRAGLRTDLRQRGQGGRRGASGSLVGMGVNCELAPWVASPCMAGWAVIGI